MTSSVLFTPVGINRMTLKNRIVMPAMASYHAAVNGEATEKLIRYHEERAKGGVGMNIVEATYVARSGNSFDLGLGISDDFMIKGLSKLTDAVHRHDGKIAIQLQHGGRFGNPPTSGCPRLLVSMIPGLAPTENARVMDADDIEGMVEAYVQAARRAVEAGFDAVEIHGAHGYLISQFLSPYTNRRTDGYGGSLENRMRFALEVCRKVRESVGPDFPVTYRMSAVEGLPGGTTLEDSVALAKRLVADGIDALHVSVGLRETNFMVSPPACVEKGWNAPLSRAVRDGIEAAVPVIVAGRVADEQTAQGIIDRGDADMVAMGRALIADPFLPAKVAAGEAGDIIRCVGCNEGCVAGSARGTGVGCALNPLSGAEGKYDLEPVASPKKVAVIGGGPAGMQAALAARFRGHTVDLYEKSDRLGGLLNVACKPPHKEDLGHVTGWFERQLKRAGVGLHLGAALTPEAVRDLGADAVIAATGSSPVFPGFCRKARNAVVAQSILSGEAKAGEKALVIGGGLIGCETAEFLAAQGSDVTILELQPELAKDMESRTRRYLMQRLREYGTRFLTGTQVLEVTEEGKVKAKFPSGSERWLDDFDTLVIAVGYRAENAPAAELEEMGCPCVRVGDCASVGKILTAIESGFQAGCSIK